MHFGGVLDYRSVGADEGVTGVGSVRQTQAVIEELH